MSSHPVRELLAVSGGGVPQHQVRARFTAKSVFVYQAFSAEIAVPAVRAQKFVHPFRKNRMTWIKPSFAWMMYRSGWGTKDGQERVLRIELTRSGFEWALSHSCLTAFSEARYLDHDAWKRSLKECPIRIQWDPERTLLLEPLPWRTIQIGIGPASVDMYVNEWVLGMEDLTETVQAVHAAVQARDFDAVDELVPAEHPYPLPDSTVMQIGARTRGRSAGVPSAVSAAGSER